MLCCFPPHDGINSCKYTYIPSSGTLIPQIRGKLMLRDREQTREAFHYFGDPLHKPGELIIIRESSCLDFTVRFVLSVKPTEMCPPESFLKTGGFSHSTSVTPQNFCIDPFCCLSCNLFIDLSSSKCF